MGTFLEYVLPRTFGLQKTSFVIGFRIFIVLLFFKKNAGNPNRLSRQHRPSACKAFYIYIYIGDNLEKTTVIWHFRLIAIDVIKIKTSSNALQMHKAQGTNKTMTNCWWQRRSTHADNYHFIQIRFLSSFYGQSAKPSGDLILCIWFAYRSNADCLVEYKYP